MFKNILLRTTEPISTKLGTKHCCNHYWNNDHYWNNYFNSGCDVKLSLKFILNHYWNNYFNSGRNFNSGCNNAVSHICPFLKILLNFMSSPRFPHKVHRTMIICIRRQMQLTESLKKKVKQLHAALRLVGYRILGLGGNYRWHSYAIWNTCLFTLEVQVRTTSQHMYSSSCGYIEII